MRPLSTAVGCTLRSNSNLHMQSQHEYMLGNYPVGGDDAAQLAALQILAEIGSVLNPETNTYVGLLQVRCAKGWKSSSSAFNCCWIEL